MNVLNRVLPVVRRIVETHRHRSVLVVSHKGTNRLLISSLLGFDMRSYRDRLDQSPAALNILDFMSFFMARALSLWSCLKGALLGGTVVLMRFRRRGR